MAAMVETWVPTSRTEDGIRPELPSGRAVPGRAVPRGEGVPGAGRQRIPTLRQLAALVVNGILTLPRNYRRGMFLDIWV